MAVGDVVNGIGASGATLTFQPAVGVEVCITSCGTSGNWICMDNGTLISYILPTTGTWGSAGANTKIMINNTNYLSLLTSSAHQNYSGIQTK